MLNLGRRDALKNFHFPDTLATNPLIDAPFVVQSAGDKASTIDKSEVLRTVIAEVVQLLATQPKGERLHRSLKYTYIESQGSQERVAEYLGLPFNTYRSHLRAGIEVVADILWNKI